MRLNLSAPKIWLYKSAVNFRKSIDGLVFLIGAQLGANPTEGVFVFCNRNKDKVKLLAWHGNGFVLLYKRLDRASLRLLPVKMNCLFCLMKNN